MYVCCIINFGTPDTEYCKLSLIYIYNASTSIPKYKVL